MSAKPDAASLLDAARASRDDLESRLLLAATVQRVADDIGIFAVVTGGTAVDFYAAGAAGTSEGYPLKWQSSADVDIVSIQLGGGAGTHRRLAMALDALPGVHMQMVRDAEGRDIPLREIRVDDYPFGLEIVGEELAYDPHAERVITIEIMDQRVIVRGPEDILVEYAESGWHFRSPRDWERALAVNRTMRDEMDLEYVRERAVERRMPRVMEHALSGQPLPDTAGVLE